MILTRFLYTVLVCYMYFTANTVSAYSSSFPLQRLPYFKIYTTLTLFIGLTQAIENTEESEVDRAVWVPALLKYGKTYDGAK